MRIGFVTIWFERGQSYVTQTLRKALIAAGVAERDLYVFARTGGVYGRAMLDDQDQWKVPNLTCYPSYEIHAQDLRVWIRQHQLDMVVFNEEYDWRLVKAAKAEGVRVVTYLDFYREDWRGAMSLYDDVWCSSHRTHNLVKDFCPARYIGWAVDLELFKPQGHPGYTFFHNAGWFGINMRKGTRAAILAFAKVQEVCGDATMMIHQQLPLEQIMPGLAWAAKKVPGIAWHTGTVRAPGLYHKGGVLVMPTKLEGLGLPLFEALACGLPVIATDEPPMNEYVIDGKTGWLVKVEQRTMRQDSLAFPECHVDVDDLALRMLKVARFDQVELATMQRQARAWAERNLRLEDLGRRLLEGYTK